MNVLYCFLLALAALCFLSGTFGWKLGRDGRPLNLLSLGLFFWVLVPFIVSAKDLS